MAKKIKQYADDGWAVWIDGEDTSTVYLNYWVNPKGKSYVDVSVKILGIKQSKSLSVFVPYQIDISEIEDVSLRFNDNAIPRAIFSAGCIVDYQKDEYTTEIAYNGKTVDVLHVSKTGITATPLANGTLLKADFEHVQNSINNEEGYVSFRLPHKSLDEVFSTYSNVRSVLSRFRDLITSPISSEKYVYSVRINESRLLPEEINKMGIFHRQKLKKALISVSIKEDYEINDANCSAIRRLEEELYRNFVPKDFDCDDVITYQWQETRKENLRGHFNFYFSIIRNAISPASFAIYMFLLLFFGVMGDAIWDFISSLIG